MRTGDLETLQKLPGILVSSQGDGTYILYESIEEVPENLYRAVFAPTPTVEEADTNMDGEISVQETETWWQKVKKFFGFGG